MRSISFLNTICRSDLVRKKIMPKESNAKMIHWTYSDKWQRYKSLLKDSRVKPYLPETVLYSKKNIIKMLSKYPSIYIKPVYGTGGSGIIKLSERNHQYILQYGRKKATFHHFEEIYYHIAEIVGYRYYMIQQGIENALFDYQPIDFRVLILKPEKTWLKIGVMGKIAGNGRIVTNKAKGGRAITFKKAMKKIYHAKNQEIASLEAKLFEIGIRAGETLSKDYQYVREIGMDVIIDKNKHIWILETNSMPHFNLFKNHEDKTLYRKIYQYVLRIRRGYNNKRL